LGDIFHSNTLYTIDFETSELLYNACIPEKVTQMTSEQSSSLKINSNLSKEQKTKLLSLLSVFADCFSWNVDDVGQFKHGPPLRIDTGDSPAIDIPPYALGSKEKDIELVYMQSYNLLYYNSDKKSAIRNPSLKSANA